MISAELVKQLKSEGVGASTIARPSNLSIRFFMCNHFNLHL
jgi:hypothetical protein